MCECHVIPSLSPQAPFKTWPLLTLHQKLPSPLPQPLLVKQWPPGALAFLFLSSLFVVGPQRIPLFSCNHHHH